jgi:hypothetical protein
VITRYRHFNVNLRTHLLRIIERAGLKPWPKLFQNLRSTRETELAENHPIHVVCAWLGNSQPVAAKHYLQVRDVDFERAAEGDAYSDALMTQNATQTGSGTTRQERQETKKAPENKGFCRVLSTKGVICPPIQVPPVGLEQTRFSSRKAGSFDFEGNGLAVEEHRGVPNLGFWDDPAEYAEWKVKFPAPGSYKITGVMAAAKGENAMNIECAGRKITVNVPRTASWDDFREVDCGTLQIDQAGNATLTARPQNPASWKAIDIRALKLAK